VIPKVVRTGIKFINSIQICVISQSKTYLVVTGGPSAYYLNRTDIFDISKMQQMALAKEVFSKPELHINLISRQFNSNSTTKGPVLKSDDSKINNPVDKQS
jgi:hypothetical protein